MNNEVTRVESGRGAPRRSGDRLTMARVLSFTLIELLVVIAIIGILASLLLPALSKAKEKAVCAECQSRLKQWTTALFMYVDENDQRLPAHGTNCGGATGDPTDLCQWKKLATHVGAAAATLDTNPVWYCPEKTEQTYQHHNGGPGEFAKHRKFGWNITSIWQPDHRCYSLTKYTKPDRTVIMGDTLYTGPYINGTDPTSNDCPGNGKPTGQEIVTWGCLAIRHMNGSNVAFIDGHVRWTNYVSARAEAASGTVRWQQP